MRLFWLMFFVLFLGACASGASYKILRNPVSGDLAKCDGGYIYGPFNRVSWVRDCVSQWEALGYVRVDQRRAE